MAEYINIKGQSIEVLASDPANPTIGQIWYNSTSNTLKGLVFQSDSWATGGNLNTGRYALAGAGTSSTTALVFGGRYPGAPDGDTAGTASESYNGTSWTSTSGLARGRSFAAGFGTQTAAVTSGGAGNPAIFYNYTDTWNGSSWTSAANINTARYVTSGSGTQTAGFMVGGNTPNYNPTNATEEYDGSAWTSVNGMLINVLTPSASCGLQTTGFLAGGQYPSVSPNYSGAPANSYSYDGTSWTAAANLNDGRISSTSFGDSGSAVTVGGSGDAPNTGKTEKWDGTTWTTSSATAARGAAGQTNTSPSSDGLVAGGGTPDTETNIWVAEGLVTRTITAS
jgi:hypothetical protein